MYPQTATGSITPIDYDSDEIFDKGNPYVMRSRMVTKSGAAGPWSAIQLPDFQVDVMDGTESDPWASSALAVQKASLDIGTYSSYYDGSGGGSGFNNYVSAVNINLLENQNQAVTGVNVWFRWMPFSLFESTPTGNPPSGMNQKVPTAADGQPSEWSLVGTYNSSSFTTVIPRKSDTADSYFQILVTDNTIVKPSRYNYRWLPATSITPSKLGELYTTGTTRGYVPWNPWYAASKVGASSAWTTYARQRSTLQDIAIFYPRKWKV